MRILLTGAEGFIGSALKQALLDDEVSQVTCIEQSYCEYKGYETTLFKAVDGCDIIYHVGAISDTMEKDVNKMMYYNVEFSKVLFDLAKILNKKVVYSSSAACYGVDGIPNNLYGWTKYITEIYGVSTVKDFIALRYFNVYGNDESHKGKMASVAYQAMLDGNKNKLLSPLAQKEKFKLFPSVSETLEDGSVFIKKPKRDFIYIEDVVSANMRCLEKVPAGVYDVGLGQSNSFEKVLKILGIQYNYWGEDKIPNGYQFETKADKNKFLPKWKPKFTLEKGLIDYKNKLGVK